MGGSPVVLVKRCPTPLLLKGSTYLLLQSCIAQQQQVHRNIFAYSDRGGFFLWFGYVYVKFEPRPQKLLAVQDEISMLWGEPARQDTKNMRAACLQAQCANNQRFFKSSREVEFFAASCLVFSIFFRKFKIAGWESYKAKTMYMRREKESVFLVWTNPNPGPKPGNPSQLPPQVIKKDSVFLGLIGHINGARGLFFFFCQSRPWRVDT